MGDSVKNQYKPNYAVLPGEVLSDELERAVGMPSNYWLNLESSYPEIRARILLC